MSQDNLSGLRFSVEESVWFQKGQEVSQLLSISLEPQVAIQEYDQYVSIRGALLLTGEYETLEEEAHSLREYTNEKHVESVLVREDGTAELSHAFPVDITIPKNRIQNMEDVYVSIDLFDYELPESDCLQLMADLSITGLYGEQQSHVREEEEGWAEIEEPEAEYEEELEASYRNTAVEEVEEEKELEVPYRNTSVEEEAKHEEELEASYRNTAVEEVEEEKELEVPYRNTSVEEEAKHEEELEASYRNASVEEEVDVKEVEKEAEVQNYFSSVFRKEEPKETLVKYEEDVYEPFEVEVKKEEAEEEREDNVIELFQAREDASSWGEEETEIAHYEEKEQEENEIVVEFRKEEESASNRAENALYLTKLFSREEEKQATWRLCIVQSGDSLDTIAERYDTNVQSLLRVNDLEDEQELEEGSILNIPVN
ncbi:stage VI sporulation protein D [Priestia flexa]|uniref:Stage VI sporulation protein D n=1 Tax=Priestia flexa TaxID=86664 RepID=A0A8I1ME33_9BACI|nr:stage VI sporulation protein D [Priestia flexa]MBN8250589.1 stage VI sporulation protein D [Priestia flexa]UIR29484.1 stage VI sporulation protein D [Priestia flexa]